MSWQFRLAVYVYQVSEEEGPADDEEGEDGVPAYSEWLLPAAQFEGAWSSLHYERHVGQVLVSGLGLLRLRAVQRVGPSRHLRSCRLMLHLEAQRGWRQV